jgi:hypothetical protein
MMSPSSAHHRSSLANALNANPLLAFDMEMDAIGMTMVAGLLCYLSDVGASVLLRCYHRLGRVAKTRPRGAEESDLSGCSEVLQQRCIRRTIAPRAAVVLGAGEDKDSINREDQCRSYG